MSETLRVAMEWSSLQIACIPILPRSKCPALDSWKCYQTRLPRLRELEAWFSSGRYGLAVLVGWQNLVVLDFDDQVFYAEWWTTLSPEQQKIMSSTYRVKTRRGFHFYFYYVNGGLRNAKLGGVDVKANCGYVLAPPTLHPSGHRYQGIGEPQSIKLLPTIGEILPEYDETAKQFTPRYVSLLRDDPFDDAMRTMPTNGGNRNYILAALDGERKRILAANEGNRNNTLFVAAANLASMIPHGIITPAQIEQALGDAALAVGLYPIEVEKTLQSAISTGINNPR
jgi:hypothetical protein